MKKYLQKLIYIVIISVFIGHQVVFAGGAVVTDPGNQVVNTKTSVESTLNTSLSFKDSLKEFGLDAVAYALAAQMGKRMSNMILNKATGGASGDGQEQYVTNFTDLLKQKDQTQVKKYITQLDALSSKNPFAAKIAKNLAKQSQSSEDALNTSVNSFNLDKVIGPNWKNFATDASVGGWNGYVAVALPQNNPYGAELLAREDLARKISSERETEKLKLLSPGINPSAGAKCDLKITKYQKQVQKQVGQVKTNVGTSKQIAGLLSDKASLQEQKKSLQKQGDTTAIPSGATLSLPQGGTSVLSSPLSGLTPTVPSTPVVQTYQVSDSQIQEIDTKIANIDKQLTDLGADHTTGVNIAAAGSAGLIDTAGQIDDCISDIITNPASATSSLIDSALTYGIEKSQNSQGWKDMLLTTFMSMTQSFLRNGGLSLFKSTGTRMASSIPSLTTGGVEDLVDSKGNVKSWFDQPDQIVDLPNDFPLAYSFSKTEIDTLRQTLDTYNQMPELFSDLNQCVPGPDTGYSKRVEEYYAEKQEKLNRLMQKDGRAWFVDWYGRRADDLEKSKDVAISEMKLYIADPKFNIPGYNILKSVADEYDSQKTTYQEIKRQFLDRQASLANILAINAKVKDYFTRDFYTTQKSNLKEINKAVTEGNSQNFTEDRQVFSKKDWDDLSPEERNSLIKWAKCFEMPKEKWDSLTDSQKRSADFSKYAECIPEDISKNNTKKPVVLSPGSVKALLGSPKDLLNGNN